MRLKKSHIVIFWVAFHTRPPSMMTTTSTTTVMMLFAAALCFLITTASALPVEHKVRMDFYQAMTKATKHSQKDLQQQRLLRLARPRVLEQGDDAVANGDDAVANGDDAVANGDDQYVNNDGLDLREYAFKYVVRVFCFHATVLEFSVLHVESSTHSYCFVGVSDD
jgi:hypothetical protein